MSSLSIRDVQKSYGAFKVLHGVDVELEDGGFLVLLGPSGCGKSTLLNIIAGLDEPSSGDIAIGGSISDGPPAEGSKHRHGIPVLRALSDHVGVSGTLTLDASEMRGVPEAAAAGRGGAKGGRDCLQIGPSSRSGLPANLSGGQRQRVAMGRAIVRSPDLFLFDEPLSNLDAKLRGRDEDQEIKRLQGSLGTTIVYVTHDQIEAMTLADQSRGDEGRLCPAACGSQDHLRTTCEHVRRRLYRISRDELHQGRIDLGRRRLPV